MVEVVRVHVDERHRRIAERRRDVSRHGALPGAGSSRDADDQRLHWRPIRRAVLVSRRKLAERADAVQRASVTVMYRPGARMSGRVKCARPVLVRQPERRSPAPRPPTSFSPCRTERSRPSPRPSSRRPVRIPPPPRGAPSRHRRRWTSSSRRRPTSTAESAAGTTTSIAPTRCVGLARAATIVDSLRHAAPGRVVLVDAGDITQGNALAFVAARVVARLRAARRSSPR